jgi:hypothetical protein
MAEKPNSNASKGLDIETVFTVVVFIAFLIGVPASLIWIFTPDSIKYPIYYGLDYSVDSSRVHFDKKPTDCDWEHAPIGNKDCHYEKQVYPVNNATGTVTDVYVTWAKTAD